MLMSSAQEVAGLSGQPSVVYESVYESICNGVICCCMYVLGGIGNGHWHLLKFEGGLLMLLLKFRLWASAAGKLMGM